MKKCLIIVNYNGESFLEKHIRYLKTECEKANIDLFVTDDESSDNSIKILNANKIKYSININENGFASNLNNGLKSVKENNYDYILVSNNDIDPFTVDLKKLDITIAEILNNNSDLGLVGFNEINQGFVNLNYLSGFKEVNSIPGFFFCLTKKALLEVGYFDEEYYMYGEDNDYFYRTKLKGLKIVRTNISIFHSSEGSTKNKSKTAWLVYRNSGLFAVKNLDFINSFKLFISFIFIIYNPFYKNNHPSVIRIKRSGFFLNNIFLLGSVLWNLNRLIKNKLSNVKKYY